MSCVAYAIYLLGTSNFLSAQFTYDTLSYIYIFIRCLSSIWTKYMQTNDVQCIHPYSSLSHAHTQQGAIENATQRNVIPYLLFWFADIWRTVNGMKRGSYETNTTNDSSLHNIFFGILPEKFSLLQCFSIIHRLNNHFHVELPIIFGEIGAFFIKNIREMCDFSVTLLNSWHITAATKTNTLRKRMLRASNNALQMKWKLLL